MPALPKTSDEAVIRAARVVLERDGAAGFSMQAVATAVGVRAPSLYKRFPDRDALLQTVAEDAARDLGARMVVADRAASTPAALTAMARAYRAFAHQAPHAYGLLFSASTPPSVEARAAAAAPVLQRLASLVGARQKLRAARLVTAWLHGFVSMELAGAFRLGGDVDGAFDYGLATLIAAAAATSRAPAGRRAGS
ncbi:MAG: TetR/AcrR family transcriptional regulator [Myxococcales bacterium]|nr:TetR/AcrR family transcriptional regulator [Myxococcales bacterium]